MVAAGDIVAGFVLERPLGAGGFGTVWLGRSQHGGGLAAAVKILHARWVDAPAEDGPSIADRFLAEAHILERLRHPGIVQLLAIVDDRPRHLIAYAMEKLTGYELTHIMTDLELHGIVEVFARVADTLAYVHLQGVIHRDVKLTNVFVCDPRPGVELVKLIDFGVAKDDGTSEPLLTTAAGSFTGTLSSMPPEAIARTSGEDVELTGAVDQWSVGIALYACLTGRLPFNSMSPLELARMIRESPPPPLRIHGRFGLKDVPGSLAQVVLRCLEKDPADRYPDAAALAVALRGAARSLRPRESFDECVRRAAGRAKDRGERTLILAYRDADAENLAAEPTRPVPKIDPSTTGRMPMPSWGQEDEESAPTMGLVTRPRAVLDVRPQVRVEEEYAPTSIVQKPAPDAPEPEVVTALRTTPGPPPHDVATIVPPSEPATLARPRRGDAYTSGGQTPLLPTVTRPAVPTRKATTSPEVETVPPEDDALREDPASRGPTAARDPSVTSGMTRDPSVIPGVTLEPEAETGWNPLIWGILLLAAAALTFAAVELYRSQLETVPAPTAEQPRE